MDRSTLPANPTRAHAPPARRALLVASVGGHLEELRRLAERLQPPPASRIWAVADTLQTRTLLRGEQVVGFPDIHPRSYGLAARTVPRAWRLLRGHQIDTVVSTGAAVAFPFAIAAQALRIPLHYIESATRSDGPSLTGRMVSYLPAARCYTQHRDWANMRWVFAGSVFDEFEPVERARELLLASSVVVTLGTQQGYPFTRAVQRLAQLLPEVTTPDSRILWQTGPVDTTPFGIRGTASVEPDVMSRAVSEADLVVAHAGVGSALMALDAGHCPVLLPRRANHGEHVDDHQILLAGELNRRGLALARDPDALTTSDLRRAMARATTTVGRTAPVRLS